jgi:nitrite reductase (NO-forming)
VGRPLPILGQPHPGGASSAGVPALSGRQPIRRDADRRLTAAGVALALAFVVGAVAAVVLGRGPWMDLHLLLTGGAGVAIGAVMPFFTAALAAAPPARPVARGAVIVALAVGALTIALAVPVAARAASLVGAGVYLLGLIGLAAVTVGPMRRALGPKRWPVLVAYLVGIAFVIAGVTLVTGMLHTFAPVTERWAVLKPVHAWLNLIGFVGLTIAGTYIHLVPTVLGARIVEGRTAWVAIGGLAAGVGAVAAGFAIEADPLARAGALLAIVGAAAVPAYVAKAARQPTRGRWTTDPGWHAFTTWSLVASSAWFAAGVWAAAGLVIGAGASPAGWSLAVVGVPLAVGTVLQAVLGAAAHLVPTIGPGDGSSRRRARGLLGRGAWLRVVGFEAGVVALAIGVPLGQDTLVLVGGALSGLATGATVLLLAVSMVPRQGGREPVA